MALIDLNSYKYYLAGRYLGILSYDEETGVYATPDENETSAIMLEYTLVAGSVSIETDTIDIDDSLQEALIYYIKEKLAENTGREDYAQKYNAKFHYHVARSQNNKRGIDVRISIPRGITVLK